jgi:carboxypeptidase Q
VRRNNWIWSFAIVLPLIMMVALGASAQGTSTPEERARWVEISHKLETNPLDESVNKDGDWALKRLSDVHDIHVRLCQSLLGEFNDSKYKYRHEITRQYMLASGAFLIENPGKAADTNAMNVAAVESVLKVYNDILQQKSDAKSKFLDDLVKKQSQGKLDDVLRKQCK